MNVGKMPPHDLDLEEVVLGAMMLEKGVFDICSSILSAECFYKDNNAKIYSCIESLVNAGSPVDMLTVGNEARSKGILEEIGGFFYISQLTARVASSANVEFHSRVIRDKYIKRKYISISAELNAMAYDDSITANGALDYLSVVTTDITNITNFGSSLVPLKEHIKAAMIQLEDRKERFRTNTPIGVPTQLNNLNKFIVAFMPNDLIILAARPSVGKTAVSLSFAKYQASLGFYPAFFSMEMDSISLVNRLMLSESNVDSDKFRRGDISSNDQTALDIAAEELSKLDLYIDDKSSVSVGYIRSKVSQLVKAGQCDIVYIDYLQIAQTVDKQRHEALGVVTAGLKALAKEFHIPIVVLSQTNRAPALRAGSKRPGMADLKESGSIEQDADLIIFVHDPIKAGELEKDDGDSYVDGEMELIVAKHRQGPVGIAYIQANDTRTNFTDARGYGTNEKTSEEINFDAFGRDSENQYPNLDFDNEFDTWKTGY